MQGWDDGLRAGALACMASHAQEKQAQMNKHPDHLTTSLDGLIDSRSSWVRSY